MAWIVAALLLLFVQQFFPSTPARQTWAEPATSQTAHPARLETTADLPIADETTGGHPITNDAIANDPIAGDPVTGEPLRIGAVLGNATSTVDKFRLVGRVVDASPTFGRGVRLTVELETLDDRAATGRVSVSLRQTSRRWRTGDRLALRSKLRRIVGFGNFGELDWAAYNNRRGILATAYAWEDDDVEVLPAADGLVDGLRRRFSEECGKVGGQGAEILEALTIGDRTGLTRETDVAVRDAGLAHYLAISGSHMALVVALMVGLVRGTAGRSTFLLERFDILRGAALLGGASVVAYGFVSGGGVSVARSVLMAVAAMIALWRGRPGDDLRALGGSAILLALVMPGVGEEAGFQLSYLAVAALILDSRRQRQLRREQWAAAWIGGHVVVPAGFHNVDSNGALPGPPPPPVPGTPVLDPPPTRRQKLTHLAIETARLTLVCWAVTSPIVAQHFQRLSLVAPLANLLAAPFVSAVVVCGLAALVVLPVSAAAASWLILLGAALSSVVIHLAAWCASLPGAATSTPSPGHVLVLSLTGLVLIALLPANRWRRAAMLACGATASVALAHGLHDRYRSDRLDVWFASVGQGDASIVRLPGGRVLVIDTGPPGRGRMVVGPLLRRAWIGRVDVLAVSHLQSDHMGAAAEILEDFEVGELWLPDGPCEMDAARALRESARQREVPVRFVSKEEGIPGLGGPAFIEVLWPPSQAAPCNENNQSLVLAIGYAGRRLLFTGDIEAEAESRLATEAAAQSRLATDADFNLEGRPLAADILKVPHHGSRTSSTREFLLAVTPSRAIASLGLDNHFNFPAADVAARYADLGIDLLRTDQHGAVHLTVTEAGEIEVETFLAGPEVGARKEADQEGSGPTTRLEAPALEPRASRLIPQAADPRP